jgi:hypothetical protein
MWITNNAAPLKMVYDGEKVAWGFEKVRFLKPFYIATKRRPLCHFLMTFSKHWSMNFFMAWQQQCCCFHKLPLFFILPAQPIALSPKFAMIVNQPLPTF